MATSFLICQESDQKRTILPCDPRSRDHIEYPRWTVWKIVQTVVVVFTQHKIQHLHLENCGWPSSVNDENIERPTLLGFNIHPCRG